MTNKPNIVFILIDDMGWRDLTCYGSTFYETPNIDKLCKDGMFFTDAYASCPVCSPTRASILTGKYPANVGITNYIKGRSIGKLLDVPYIDHLPDTEISLAKSLKEGGYNTWHVGKWHLGGRPYFPEDHGFDVNIGGCHWGHPKNGYFSPWGIETLSDGINGEYLTDRLTDEAICLIKNNIGKPFFLNLWHYTVHIPIQAKEEYVEKYKNKATKLGLDKLKTFEKGEKLPVINKRHKNVYRRLIQSDPVYAAMIEILDENIGRLVKSIDETGQSENTIIFFTSDNGGLSTTEGSPTCNFPLLEGKGWMYEGGIREPLIIKWPKVINPGSVCSTPVTSTDFYPTLLEIAGLDLLPEQHTDGISILPLLQGENRLDRDTIFWHFPHYGNQGGTPTCAIRMGEYKLIEFFEDKRLELYNLKEDISEKHNIADNYPELVKQMHDKLIHWRESVHAKIPEPNPEWNELE